MAPGATEKI
jgi:hypothetical protein